MTPPELVRLAEGAFAWKRATAHTVLERSCEKGLSVIAVFSGPAAASDLQRIWMRIIRNTAGCCIRMAIPCAIALAGPGMGLGGRIMAVVCERLLQTESKPPADGATAETGQP